MPIGHQTLKISMNKDMMTRIRVPIESSYIRLPVCMILNTDPNANRCEMTL